MARLPVPGGDEDVWGEVLNEFLVVSHNDDGTLKGVDNINGVTINGTPDTDSVIVGDSSTSATWQPSPFINSSTLGNYGDLLTYSNAPSALPIGEEGAVLTVDYNSGVGISWMNLPAAITGITTTGAITIDNSNPANPVIGFNAANLSDLFPQNSIPGETLVKQADGTIAWKNDSPRLTPKIIQFSSGGGRDLNGPTDITANFNNNPIVGNTVLMAIYIRSSGPTMSGWSNPAAGWSVIQNLSSLNDSLIVGMKTLDSANQTIDLGEFVSTDGNSAYSWALYELSGLSESDSVGFMDYVSGEDQTQSHFQSGPYSPKGGLGLVILGNRSVSGYPFAAGPHALPVPSNLDINNEGFYCSIGTYTVDLNNSTEFIGHMTGTPGNAGNDTYVGLALVLLGDLLTSTVVNNPNSNSSSRDSRISLATGDTNVLLDTVGTWVHVGVDTAPWRYMHGSSPGYDLAGPDFTLASDGSGINVLNDCTIMVRLAFQISAYNNTNLAYAAPTFAVTNGSGFPGLISGDGDPISQAINGVDQDLIFNWIWRVSAGSKLEFSVRVAGNDVNQHTDGFCLDVVRIS